MSTTSNSSDSAYTDSEDSGHPADRLIVAKAAAKLATAAAAQTTTETSEQKKRKRKRAAEQAPDSTSTPLQKSSPSDVAADKRHSKTGTAVAQPLQRGAATESSEESEPGDAAQRKQARKAQKAAEKRQRAKDAQSLPQTPNSGIGHSAATAATTTVAIMTAEEPSVVDPIDLALAALVDAEQGAPKRRKKSKRGKVPTEATTVIEVEDELTPIASTTTGAVTNEFTAAVDTPGHRTPASARVRGTGGASNQKGTAQSAGKGATPIGVIIIGDDEEITVNPEMRRLLRIPRYFDDDFEAAATRCYKCGGSGHMARDCVEEGRQRPCYLCAQFGHGSVVCPARLCFRCSRPGHMARECPNGYSRASEKAQPVCLRCGRTDCDGITDSVRAAGMCSGSYARTDLALVRCYVCGEKGHLCCAVPPATTYRAACHNCGDAGHTADECRRERPPTMRNERAPTLDYTYGNGAGSKSSGYAYGSSGGGSGGARWDSRLQSSSRRDSGNDRYDGRSRDHRNHYESGGNNQAAARQRSFSRYHDSR